jgi:hypothetical protein
MSCHVPPGVLLYCRLDMREASTSGQNDSVLAASVTPTGPPTVVEVHDKAFGFQVFVKGLTPLCAIDRRQVGRIIRERRRLNLRCISSQKNTGSWLGGT